MSVADVREAMAAALNTIDGLICTPYVTDQISPPHAMLDFDVVYDLTFSGNGDTYMFFVEVFLPRTDEHDAQLFGDNLRDPRSSTSIKTVIEADAGVAATVDYAQINKASRVSAVTVNSVDYLYLELEGEVVISG